jgi:predicted nuclease of predicted toxin-antitoxin system
MIFLVDQMLPRRLADWIRSHGHQALHVREIAMDHANDKDIWREATARGATLVTKDEDFSVIVGAVNGPQVVWLRVGNCSNDALIAQIAQMWPQLVSELESGIVLVEVR